MLWVTMTIVYATPRECTRADSPAEARLRPAPFHGLPALVAVSGFGREVAFLGPPLPARAHNCSRRYSWREESCRGGCGAGMSQGFVERCRAGLLSAGNRVDGVTEGRRRLTVGFAERAAG